MRKAAVLTAIPESMRAWNLAPHQSKPLLHIGRALLPCALHKRGTTAHASYQDASDLDAQHWSSNVAPTSAAGSHATQ